MNSYGTAVRKTVDTSQCATVSAPGANKIRIERHREITLAMENLSRSVEECEDFVQYLKDGRENDHPPSIEKATVCFAETYFSLPDRLRTMGDRITKVLNDLKELLV